MQFTTIEMEGRKIGRLTVLEKSHKDKRGEQYWKCVCDCGNIKTVSGYKLRSGNTKSCGCLQKEIRSSGALRRTHGKTNTRIYATWCNMRARCQNKKSFEYKSYGGRGIKVCDEWQKFEPFYTWAMETGYTDEMTIDRIDVNGNYCPENCRWLSGAEQSLNRTDNHLITAFGETKTIKEWADSTGIKYDTIERRINAYGWTAEDALRIKPGSGRKRSSKSR